MLADYVDVLAGEEREQDVGLLAGRGVGRQEGKQRRRRGREGRRRCCAGQGQSRLRALGPHVGHARDANLVVHHDPFSSFSSTRMSSSSPIGCLQRLMAALLVLVIAATAASAANVGTPVKNGAAHAIAAIGRQLAPAKPEPSRRMGKKKRAGGAKTRRTKGRNDYSQFLCPSKVDACPIAAPGETLAAVKRAELKVLADWFKAGFECIDTQTELVSCGGCMSLGQGCVPP